MRELKVENGPDVLLSLLYTTKGEGVEGITRLQKLIFLLERESSLVKYLDQWKFKPYNFGPYSNELFDALEALETYKLIKTTSKQKKYFAEIADECEIEDEIETCNPSEDSVKIYYLTDKGEKVGKRLFDSLSSKEKEDLERVINRYNSISLQKLLHYVYSTYEEMTSNSIIKDKVLH